MTVRDLIDFLKACPLEGRVCVKTSNNKKEIIDAIAICTRTDNIIIETVEEEN